MHEHFKDELWRTAVALLLGSLLGSASGIWSGSFILALIGLLSWHLYQIFHLERYLLTNSPKSRSHLSGIWLYMADHTEQTNKKSLRRKKRLSGLLQRFHQTLEALPDSAVVLNEKQQITWVNSAAKNLLDISHHDFGEQIDLVIDEPDLGRYLRNSDFSDPVYIKAPANPKIELEVKITVFNQGQLLLSAHDVTESQQLQTMRRDFVANVSHELRTPLTVITGYMEMLQQEELPPAVSDAIESSNRQALRMQSIVRDLLMLSRLEMDGDIPASDNEAVDVAHLLPNLLKDAQRLSAEKNHQFNLNADENIQLLGVEHELTSAFGNLIFNAVVHTPADTVIDVYWGASSEGARLVVADKGPGIDPEHLQRLEERFYRVDKGRSRESGGTGLGLSIVKHVIKRHQGRVTIESAPGSGSRFICTFPHARIVNP